MEIRKRELEKLYRTMLIKDLVERLGISTRTLYRYLSQNNISKRGKIRRLRKIYVK